MSTNDTPEGIPDDLAALLADENTWADTSAATEDSIVAAIMADAGSTSPRASSSEDAPNVASLDDRRRSRLLAPLVAGIAAGLMLLVGYVFLADDGGRDRSGIELALEATELAPDAGAVAFVSETPIGTRIVLDISGLPPAASGTYYEAWMRIDAATGVSAGTFHMRGGDGEIELWSGVLPDAYPLLTITVQDEGSSASSGRVVLKGLLS